LKWLRGTVCGRDADAENGGTPRSRERIGRDPPGVVEVSPRRANVKPDAEMPPPWRIVDGPSRISQSVIDGTAWGFTLECGGGQRRSLIVAVTRQALGLGAVESLPVETREAVQTDGRSEAARVAQFNDPTGCVLLGRHGYLPPPPGLLMFARR
jgi:hypothetical protein